MGSFCCVQAGRIRDIGWRIELGWELHLALAVAAMARVKHKDFGRDGCDEHTIQQVTSAPMPKDPSCRACGVGGGGGGGGGRVTIERKDDFNFYAIQTISL